MKYFLDSKYLFKVYSNDHLIKILRIFYQMLPLDLVTESLSKQDSKLFRYGKGATDVSIQLYLI